MKFICTQENIHRGLAITSHVASRTTNLPILANILFETRDNTICFTATNLEMGVQTNVRGRVEGEGRVAVPAKLIYEYVAVLPLGNVELTLTPDGLVIKSERYQSRLHTIPAEDFPILPRVEEKSRVILSASTFAQVLKTTVFAADFDETRQELSGIYLTARRGKCIVAATNSFRLAERVFDLGDRGGAKEFPGIIVPLRTMQEVMRILALEGGEEKEVCVVLGEHQALITVGNTQVVTRLIDAQYPSYTEIFPRKYNTSARVERAALQQALRAASLFSRSGMNDVTIAFLPEVGVRLNTSNLQVGENTTTVSAQIEGKDAEVTLNWRYLAEGIESMSSDIVHIELTDSANPVVLRPEGVDGHIYLIMPIRQ